MGRIGEIGRRVLGLTNLRLAELPVRTGQGVVKPIHIPTGTYDVGGVTFKKNNVDPAGGEAGKAFSLNNIPSLPRISSEEKTKLLAGKTVFMRLDLNLKPTEIRPNSKKLKGALDSIKESLDFTGISFIASHRSDPLDPNGKVNLTVSMRPVFEIIKGEFPGKRIFFAGDYVEFKEGVVLTASDFKNQLDTLREKITLLPGDIVVLENLRFYPENVKDKSQVGDFAKTIANNFDIYVDDAFGTVHRAHASMIVPSYKEESYIGRLIQKELDTISPILINPKRPYAGISSGSKITPEAGKEGKIEILVGLLPLVDQLLIAGAMGNAFLCARLGWKRLGSYVPTEKDLEAARDLLSKWGDKIKLPLDIVFVKNITSYDQLIEEKNKLSSDRLEVKLLNEVKDENQIPLDYFPADIGDETLKHFEKILQETKTIFANGSAGVHEIPLTAKGSLELIKLIDQIAAEGVYVLGGGGDFLKVAREAKTQDIELSTGGGALLSVIAKNGKVPAFTAFFSQLK